MTLSSSYQAHTSLHPGTEMGESATLLRLPPELRQKIYKTAMFERRIHLRYEIFLGAIRGRVCEVCVSDDPSSCGRACWRPNRNRQGLLSLPLTCHQLYNDTISLLYSENSFQVRRWPVLVRFSQTVPSHHLQAIRKLRLHMDTSHPPPLHSQSFVSPHDHHLPEDVQSSLLDAKWASLSGAVQSLRGLNNLEITSDVVWDIPRPHSPLNRSILKAVGTMLRRDRRVVLRVYYLNEHPKLSLGRFLPSTIVIGESLAELIATTLDSHEG